MVSLIDRTNYFKTILSSDTNKYFYDFICKKSININIDKNLNETEKYFYIFINSFIQNDKKIFEKNFIELSTRKPNIDCAWIYNEQFIFTLICGIRKFAINKDWINEVIQTRSSDNEHLQQLNITYKNIINDNINSLDNLFEIVIVFSDLLNQPLLTNQLLNQTYLKISNNINLLDIKNDFFNLISIRAYDLIIVNKDTPDSIKISELKNFELVFIKRINIISDIVCILIFIGIIFCGYWIISINEWLKEPFYIITGILSFLGISLLFSKVSKRVKNLLFLILGYKNLIK